MRQILTVSLTAFLFGVANISCAENVQSLWQSGSDRVKTVQFRIGDQSVSWPVVRLVGDNSLRLHFDILFASEDDEENMPWLRARIEHRDSEWESENISENEYIDGFNVSDVGFGEPSIGGITTLYRHYSLDVPPADIKPKISGNYLLQIYADSNPDSMLLTVPFMVEENSARISGKVSPVTDIDYKKSHQQVEVEISGTSIDSRFRPSEFKVFIIPNSILSGRRALGYPTYADGNTVMFKHKNGLVFPASNEYRRMEISDNTIPMLNVDHIEWHSPFYHQILKTDSYKAEGQYVAEYNNNGRFTVREYNSENPDTEADYCVVHFTLDGKGIPHGSEIFIEGDFTGRKTDESNRMSWDESQNVYYKSMLLKQGAYDYKYVTKNSSETFNPVEGDFYETGNIYNVTVYYRLPGERFDRLASTGMLAY